MECLICKNPECQSIILNSIEFDDKKTYVKC